jgi:AcrB/AcrD/AcrF family
MPLIILLTVPLGLMGVVFALFVSNTTLNIQSFLGVIMMVGITVAYTNLLVDKITPAQTPLSLTKQLFRQNATAKGPELEPITDKTALRVGDTHEGTFQNGITTVQSMYAPEFSSHSEGVLVRVGGR